MFDVKLSKPVLRKEFEKRVWTSTEIFSDYLHEKVILGNQIDVDDEELIDGAIDRIPNERLRDQARMRVLGRSEANSRRPVLCYNCSESGRFLKDCSKPRRQRGTRFKCGSTAHRVENCTENHPTFDKKTDKTTHLVEFVPKPPYMVTLDYSVASDQGQKNRYCIDAIVDSGSPISLVKEGHVSDSDCFHAHVRLTDYQ
ncbi:hypothetical protein KPH14_000809 [Odynerus spinipes]|uniref:CCHC-type domain-containing protein n=1 Tax=Odynerus spinipes TaxID=1348599 RepID=A0AAD9R9M3_9HYME|nr:hypothetical protein KPH14_000809 [Odynerus spinipes]